MYTQIPGQKQQIYTQNYAPGLKTTNVVLPNQAQYQYQMQYNIPQGTPVQMQIPGDKRKTFTPGQYQREQIGYPKGQPVPQQPIKEQVQGNKKLIYSHSPYQNPQLNLNPMPGHPQHHHQNPYQPPQYIQHQHHNQTQLHHQPQIQTNPAAYAYPQPQVQPQIHNNQAQPNPQPQAQPQMQNNQIQPHMENPQINNNNANMKKTATLMTVNTLANLPYSEYPKAEYSHKPFYNISGYAFNSYNGKVRSYNEDRTKIVVDFQKTLVVNGKQITPRISYFGVFDGHGGKGCSDFLRDNLHNYLFNSNYFPAYPIQAVKEAFIIAEQEFFKKAYDSKRNALIDQSGSCALIMLIINDMLYAINLGDCRALMSTDTGTNLLQITRDHKPNDPIEKIRIEQSGAKVYYANKVNVNGKEVELKEKDYGEGFKFPYRIAPGGIAVSISYYFIIIYLGFKNYWRLLCKIKAIRRNSRSFKC